MAKVKMAAGVQPATSPAHGRQAPPVRPPESLENAFPALLASACGHAEQIKQEWESTADVLPEFICLLDASGSITRSNRTMERWGLGRVTEAHGRDLHDLMHPGCDEAACYLKHFLADAFAGLGQGSGARCQAEDPALGRFLDIQLHPYRRSNPHGAWPRDSHAVAVIPDISEIKPAETSLQTIARELDQRVRTRTAELEQTNRQLCQEARVREQAQARLQASQQELRLLSARVLSAQEMERQRIAAELHDGIGQTLSAIKFHMETAMAQAGSGTAEHCAALLDSVIPKLQGAIEEVRRISMDLRPSILDDLGILATLGWFCREFQAVYENVQIELRTGVREAGIPAPLKAVIFRIVQEALNNAAKHARTDHVRISLGKIKGGIRLEILDKGVGFNLAEIAARRARCSGGSGLVSMRERSQHSGGSFLLNSAMGQGTCIRVFWPDSAIRGQAMKA